MGQLFTAIDTSPIITIALSVYAALVTALLRAELRRNRRAQYALKPLSAIGFCLIAVLCGAAETAYGLIILAALVLCAIGDAALLPRDNETWFKIGMAAFGMGHIVYAAAFAQMGLSVVWALSGAALMAATGYGALRHLRAHAPASMHAPLKVYTLIISVMVIAAISTQRPSLIIPALMFAASDIFVARDRFVKRAKLNPIIITPLYFGAQALFALSV